MHPIWRADPVRQGLGPVKLCRVAQKPRLLRWLHPRPWGRFAAGWGREMRGRTDGLTGGAPKPVRPPVMAVSLRWSAEWTRGQGKLPPPGGRLEVLQGWEIVTVCRVGSPCLRNPNKSL